MTSIPSIVAAIFYLLAARFLIRRGAGTAREFGFAVLNLAGFFCFFCMGQHLRNSLAFGIYISLVVVQYLALRLFATKPGVQPWLAFFAPLVFLVLIRYVPGSVYASLLAFLPGRGPALPSLSGCFVGISYLTFRCSRLILEIRNGVVKKPKFLEYLNFAFFLPTMPVGPINTYANFRRGFEASPVEIPMSRAALRVMVGYVKYQWLGNFFGQLDYGSLLLDDHLHPWLDLPVAMLFFYLYLYLNFSGFCDMAIGAAGLIGIPVPENFDHPFAARNVKDFWNRWHITLSVWMRDVVFSPLSKFLVGKMGIKLADHAIALTITVVFLLVGIWHGAGWNFAAYGAVHALGVVANHYYTIFLKKKLGREKFKAYNENRWIRAVAVTLTFGYCAASLFLFANTFPQMKEIFAALR